METDRGFNTGFVVATATATGLAGVMVGFLIGSSGITPGAPSASPAPVAQTAPAQTAPAAGFVTDSELQAYRNILAREPKNVSAATTLGNKLYDAGRYSEAIPYYQQAFAADARNVNLSTDLGTALWYAGRVDEALVQYDHSLAIDPGHAQTLFNLGIVRLEGKQDAVGAITVWEKLLAANPSYPEAGKVRDLIANARASAILAVSGRTS